MSNFFTVDLDTTGPNIAISAPTYTLPGILTEIDVYANEALDDFQDIYIVDAKGTTHNVIFQNLGDHFYGLVDFQDYSVGIATVYARVRDTVQNMSNTAAKTINILQSNRPLKINAVESIRAISLVESTRMTVTAELIRAIPVSERTRNVLPTEVVRGIETKEMTRSVSDVVSVRRIDTSEVVV